MRNIKNVGYMLILFISLFAFNKISAYKSYSIGDEVDYNDIKFYVIKDSSSDEESVTMLKAEPLSLDEILEYSSGMNFKIITQNGYAEMEYGSTGFYEDSYVKKIVDAWAVDTFDSSYLLEMKLITNEELIAYLGYEDLGNAGIVSTEQTPMFMFNFNHSCWTMCSNCNYFVPYFNGNGGNTSYVTNTSGVLPMVSINKIALNKEEVIDDNIDNKDSGNNKTDTIEIIDKKNNDNEKTPLKNIGNSTNNNEIKTKVNVPNTLQKVSIVFILIGVVLVSISTIILIKKRNIIKK